MIQIRPDLFLIFFSLFYSVVAFSQNHPNSLAISQGISSPSRNHTALYSNGFILENPVAASYQNGYRFTGSLDGSESSSVGVEGGLGDNQYGLALGYYSNDCDGCDANLRGSISAIWGKLGIGLGVQEDLYTLGILINPNGIHRFGIMTELVERNSLRSSGYGLGYSFVLPRFTFSLDMSKQNYENSNSYDNPIVMTPGLAVRIDIIAVSLSYDIFIDDPLEVYENQVWFGLGVNPYKNWELAFYSDYIDRWTLQASYFF